MTNFTTPSSTQTHTANPAVMGDASAHSATLHDKNANTDEQEVSFETLGLHSRILNALKNSGYTRPTPIQAMAIPHAMNGRDLLLSAQTGSGKTAAFVLPVLNRLANPVKPAADKENFSQKSHNRYQKPMIKALILTPTRELALQVQDNVRGYGSGLKGVFSVPLVGGAPYGGQIRALRKGVQIVIATPGRLIDHLNEGRVDLSELDTLILDEADRMLDMGFADDIRAIVDAAPSARQTIMSSATWDGAVGKIAESFTVNPERVSIKIESAHIDESVYYCDDFYHKNAILTNLLASGDINQAVIFTATKRSTETLAESLNDAGFKARYLHGDLPQAKRNRIINDVKQGKCDFLIATDVAARGIDISAISHVVNYDLPRQVEDYVHRIGRCGRAGRTGVAMNLCSMDDRKQLNNINRYLKRTMKEAVVEGLEPKRARPLEEKRNKRSDKTKGERGVRFGRQDGRKPSRRHDLARQERDFEKREFGNREFGNREFGNREFGGRDFGNRNSGNHHGQKRFANRERSFDRSGERNFEERGERSYERKFDGKPKRAHGGRAYDERAGVYSPNGERAPKRKANFDKPSYDKSYDKGYEKAGYAKPNRDKSSRANAGKTAHKKPRMVEEVFFSGKRARKFGDL
ncbi:ATP-dependent RNA helicase rhlE [Moraxella caviae]|nr:ATP-dependent RNA helicase rhlE [Moraxella caviae]